MSVQNIIYAKKSYVWKPATCSCKNSKYLANIFDNSVITCDQIIDVDAEAKSYDEETKVVTTNCNEKKCNLQNKKFQYLTCIFINYYYIYFSIYLVFTVIW